MKKTILLLLFLILFPAISRAQNSRRDDIAQRSVNGFSSFISGATITVYKSDGITLSPICSSESDTTCNQPNPFNSDAFGNYGFWLPPGIGEFVVNISSTNGVNKTVTYTIPCDPKSCVGTTFLGSLKVNALGTPSSPVVTVVGTPGVTSYTYFCDSRDANSNQTLPSAGTTITTGNSSLSVSNYNSVTCAENGAYRYDVLKTNTSTLLATVTPSFPGGSATLNDIGQTTSGYTPPSQDNTGGSATLFSQLGGSIAPTQFGSQINLIEGTAPSGTSSTDILWADSSAHRFKMNNNNGTAAQVVASGVDINTSDQVTQLHFGSTATPLSVVAPSTGQVPQWNGTSIIWSTIGASNIQSFCASGCTVSGSGTWNKPTGANTVVVVLIGGGGGGAGGTGAAGSGGGGGGGGGYSYATIPASVVGSSETVTVGSGGSGGPAAGNGTNGTASSFGNWVMAGGGAAANAATAGTGGTGTYTGGAGGNGGSSSNGAAGSAGPGLAAGGGGGGAGGGGSTTGGAGGNGSTIHGSTLTGGSGGTPSCPGGAGGTGTSSSILEPAGGPGGGGGGNCSSSSAGGAGGSPVRYGNGGGGGGSSSSGSGGVGGNGANGIVIVISY